MEIAERLSTIFLKLESIGNLAANPSLPVQLVPFFLFAPIYFVQLSIVTINDTLSCLFILSFRHCYYGYSRVALSILSFMALPKEHKFLAVKY